MWERHQWQTGREFYRQLQKKEQSEVLSLACFHFPTAAELTDCPYVGRFDIRFIRYHWYHDIMIHDMMISISFKMSCNYIILTLFRFSQIYTYDYLIHMMKMYVQMVHRTHRTYRCCTVRTSCVPVHARTAQTYRTCSKIVRTCFLVASMVFLLSFDKL